MYLAGDVTPAGDVRIHMHRQRSDGSRLAVMDLAGTLQDCRIEAKGSFLNGRSVTELAQELSERSFARHHRKTAHSLTRVPPVLIFAARSGKL
jgi:hypothetical protein